MKVEQILKQITPERRKEEIEKINKVKLPKELQKWVDKYEEVGGERDEFIWKWTYAGMQIYTLSSVPRKCVKQICIIKTINIIINVLIDDIVDKRKSKKILKEIINNCIFSKNFRGIMFKKEDRQYIDLTGNIWDFVNREIKKYPRYKEFKDIFRYDYRQFINSVKYSYLINKNFRLINKKEYYVYMPANMQATVSMTIDLMCSPKFNSDELGAIREISWYSQEMLRIGNWVSTWKREIRENDFTSGVFAHAVHRGVVDFNDLDKRNESKIIEKIEKSKVEEELLKEWEICYFKIKKISKSVKSVNVEKIISSVEKFLIMHLTSSGYK